MIWSGVMLRASPTMQGGPMTQGGPMIAASAMREVVR